MNRTKLRAAAGGRMALIALGAALLATLATPALAEPETAEGSAAGVDIEGVVTVGGTSGTTEGGEGEATATGISVLGEDVSGGSQSGPGTSSGEFASTGETEAGEVTVAPWEATVEEDGSTSSSAALASVTVVDSDTATVEVLASNTDTSAGSAGSHSDGIRMSVGGDALLLHLLHAEANSSGTSMAAVALINGTGYITDAQTGGALCPTDLLVVTEAEIVCAAAGATWATSGVVTTDAIAGETNLVTAEGERAQAAAPGTPAAPAPPVAAAPPAPSTPIVGAPAGPVTPAPLPRTGIEVFALLGLGLGSIGAGETLRRLAR